MADDRRPSRFIDDADPPEPLTRAVTFGSILLACAVSVASVALAVLISAGLAYRYIGPPA